MKKYLLTIIFITILITPLVYADKEDPMLEYIKGTVEGHSVIIKTGHSEDIGVDLVTVWDNSTLYPWLETATFLNFSSTDADDTLFGSGAWNVTIVGLDANYVEQTETVVMNGLTPVSTTLEYLRIFRMEVRKSGASQTNEGIIKAGTGPTVAGDPLNEYSRISANYGQSQIATYTVPANHTAFIRYIDITTWASVIKRFEVYLIHRPYNESFKRTIEWNFDRSTHMIQKYYLRFEPRTDIEFRAHTSAGVGFVSVVMDIVLVENEYVDIDQVFSVEVLGEVDVSLQFFIFIIIAFGLMFYAWRTERNNEAAMWYAFAAVFWVVTMYQWTVDNYETDAFMIIIAFLVPLTFCVLEFIKRGWYTYDDFEKNQRNKTR